MGHIGAGWSRVVRGVEGGRQRALGFAGHRQGNRIIARPIASSAFIADLGQYELRAALQAADQARNVVIVRRPYRGCRSQSLAPRPGYERPGLRPEELHAKLMVCKSRTSWSRYLERNSARTRCGSARSPPRGFLSLEGIEPLDIQRMPGRRRGFVQRGGGATPYAPCE
jgi:hypothetical protein